MEIKHKLLKQIDEARYLTAENAWRYRTILRFFYLQYEKMKYWMYKEDVLEELKRHGEFKSYTMELLKQDLDVLVSWKNLVPIQDTSRVSTVEEFKNKQFRYQLSEYSVEIERLTIRLENLFVENASLEPSLLEKLKRELERFPEMIYGEEKVVGAWWRDLNNDFKRLNQNYQDYIGDFYSLKAEEMMKTREFLVYKERFIDYLRDFIKGLQYNVSAIESILKNISQQEEKEVLHKIFSYEKSIPRLDEENWEEDILDNIQGKWINLKGWFLGENGRESEASRLFDMTNEIIRKITRFASQISESRNSAANRKEEYRKLAEMFLCCQEISEAHMLSALAFGIFHPRHIRGDSERKTESINSGIFDEEPYLYRIKPRTRNYREKEKKTPIIDHTEKKAEMLEKVMKDRQQEKDMMESYVRDGVIDFESLPMIDAQVRTTLLKWLARGVNAADGKGKTEYGILYQVVPPEEGKRCNILCEDGNFEMPSYRLHFEQEREG
ncbi:TIGR02677 family protein [Anaerosolibacter sp.]|uniref:TIGR02677 family protein n=1 Tax=Anaerosolibacter sp. TaxID=1872527 RepID=UPI0039EF45EF